MCYKDNKSYSLNVDEQVQQVQSDNKCLNIVSKVYMSAVRVDFGNNGTQMANIMSRLGRIRIHFISHHK